MKNLISFLTLVALSTAFLAQTPTTEKKVRIIVDKDENGVVTKLDTTIELTNSVDIQDVLQQYGIDADIDINGEKGSSQAKRFELTDGSVMELLENMEGLDDATRQEVKEALERVEGMEKGLEGEYKGVKMIREIRVVIKLEDVNDEDKATLKRAGAPVAPSIAESLQLDDLVFYPNPNVGRFRLRFNAPNDGDVQIRVVNMEGKILYSDELPSFSGSYDEVISIEDQAAGAYLLSISQNGQTVNKKLVKQ